MAPSRSSEWYEPLVKFLIDAFGVIISFQEGILSILEGLSSSSLVPSSAPSTFPTTSTSAFPSKNPSGGPTESPTNILTFNPSVQPTKKLSGSPSAFPSKKASAFPSKKLTGVPTFFPSGGPTESPTNILTFNPSVQPTKKLSGSPSAFPSKKASAFPSEKPITWSQVGDDVNTAGTAVALSNDGSRLFAGGYNNLGFYDLVGDNWNQIVEYLQFSIDFISVSADERSFVAGDPASNSKTGSATVFQELSDNFWEQKGETLIGGKEGDSFGTSVAMNGDGTVIVVGAPGCDPDFASVGEYVELFVHEDNVWKSRKIISRIASYFGHSVALSSDGTRLIVGAHIFDYRRSGIVDFFLLPLLELEQTPVGDEWDWKEQSISGGGFDRFGYSVSMSSDGSVMVAGSTYREHVKIFKIFEATDGSLQYKQMGDNVHLATFSGSLFGSSVSLSSDGKRLAVGAPFDNEGGENSGKVFVFDINDDGHKLIGEFIGEAAKRYFGYSVSISGDGRRVTGNGEYVGHVRVYESAV